MAKDKTDFLKDLTWVHVSNMRWGLGWGLKWKLIWCEMGLEANPPTCPKGKHITHQEESSVIRVCRREARHVVTSSGCWQGFNLLSHHYFFFPWWGINNLNSGVRITATALINNATAWLDTGWMNGGSTGYKLKVSSQRDLREWA